MNSWSHVALADQKEASELDRLLDPENTKDRFDFAAKILKDYKNIESNIPVYHPYWKVRP
jgi:hypothetical protein